MTCDECRQQLVLAEDEGTVAVPAEEHLRRCLACQGFVQDGERVRKEVHLLAETEQAPPELREQVRGMIDRDETPRGITPRLWAEVAAAIVVVALTGYAVKWFYAMRTPTPDGLARDFISDHLNYLPGKEEIISDSGRDIEQWFQGRVDFPVRVPELPATAIADARVCQIAGRKAALVHYRRKPDETLISLFVTVEPPSFEQARKPMEISSSYQGLNSKLWCHRGLVFSLVAALDDTSLNQMADSVRKQAP